MKPKRSVLLVIEKKPVRDVQRLILAEEERLERWESALTKAGRKAVELQRLMKEFA